MKERIYKVWMTCFQVQQEFFSPLNGWFILQLVNSVLNSLLFEMPKFKFA